MRTMVCPSKVGLIISNFDIRNKICVHQTFACVGVELYNFVHHWVSRSRDFLSFSKCQGEDFASSQESRR
ncbi:hypothetical protein CEXT_101501 [Caerostris extrusa]|uniref:Uncharacterized protein n=1 Tax=Caerostris extrusa TaxID=172846 RepID=A0AAV4V9M4_CAEEX|nr:hypothetical protein CEXT_101501 [Caerostris extrusa]